MTSAIDPRSRMILVNDVKLQYLDWGGEGRALIFLAGFANTPHFFDPLARQFSHRFHVLGLTRRAHGESEQPEDGYDIDTLASDIVGFMDALEIGSAVLVGHSFAGREMAYLAANHPDRVDRLVFLDALYDSIDEDMELFAGNPVPTPAPPPESFASVAEYCDDFGHRYLTYRPLRSPRWDALWGLTLERRGDGRFIERMRPETARKLSEGTGDFHPEFSAIRCPALVFYAYQTADWSTPDDASEELREQVRAYVERMNRQFKDRNVDRARREIAKAEVIVFDDTSHYCFIDREADVVAAMQPFLD
jgi:non-heme chloroperoxidase